MDQDKIFEFILEIKSSLASIDSKVNGITDQLRNHESRIQKIEEQSAKQNEKQNDTTTKILGGTISKLLTILGYVIGGSALIAKFCA